MNTTELIKQLRGATQAGMKDCIDALKEADNDLEKAIDLIKIKGKNIVSGRSDRIASEGMVIVGQVPYSNAVSMLEINCQTDFVARSSDFQSLLLIAFQELNSSFLNNQPFDVESPLVSAAKEHVVSTTKENVVIRRWWVEEPISSAAKVFNYLHNGSQLGVILTLHCSNESVLNNPKFIQLGNDLAMQVAAMNPLAISSEHVTEETKERQRSIFETQLRETNKPESAWSKILTGKFGKWYSEVCLLEQESVLVPKTTVKDVIAQVSKELGCDIAVTTMIRCQVGDGIVKEKSDLADEVATLMSQNDSF